MDLGLQGKIAVVTGSTAGIGFAIASVLAQEGAEVVVSGRSAERVNSAVEAIRGRTKGKSIRGVAANLGTLAGVESLQKQITKTDILVNNLGIFEPKAFL